MRLYDKHFDLNARGVYFTVQKALPLLADNASIILSGSAAWQMGLPAFGAYSATKAALVSFVRTWTAELASRGIHRPAGRRWRRLQIIRQRRRRGTSKPSAEALGARS
jgi:NADP-dependent 3-hydroxy acid dehydrogenase YdfG